MGNFFSQITKFWQRLSLAQKLSLSAASIVTIGIICALVFYSSQAEYKVLFTNLKPNDAQKVVEKLKSSQVSYQLSDYGTTINVPSEQVMELRLQVAGSGLLSGGHVGFDIFDKNSFGITDFTQQVNYQRALEGELAKTLENMFEVKSARVHITRVKESVFIDKTEPAKASVMLDLATTRISPERSEAIVNLIASAVEGLAPENITITDTQGHLLAGGRNNQTISSLSALDKLMETRRKLEIDISERVVGLLEPIAGVGKVKANVMAEVDFNQVEQVEEKFDPKSAVIRAQQLSQEFKNSVPPPAGIAGPQANDPTAKPITIDSIATANNNGRSANTTTYEIDKINRKIIGSGGQITKISVSVLVDEQNGNKKRSPEELQKIQELVAAAVGINTTRGDQIAVQMISFNQPAPIAITPSWLEANREFVKLGARYGTFALISLLLILMVVRPALRILKTSLTPETVPATEGALLLADTSKALPAANENKLSEKDNKLLISNLEKESKESKENKENKESDKLALVSTDTPISVAELVAEVDKDETKPSVADRKLYAESQMPNIETDINAIRKQLILYSKTDPSKVALTLRSWLREEDA